MLETLLQTGWKRQDPTSRNAFPKLTDVKAANLIRCPGYRTLGSLPVGIRMTKKTVLRAAQTMIDRFGDEALAEVDLRISELRVRGEHNAEELWKEIREAVMFLTSKSDTETKH